VPEGEGAAAVSAYWGDGTIRKKSVLPGAKTPSDSCADKT
jgi:hypothetical protein